MQSKLTLISSYAPILFAVRAHIVEFQTDVAFKGRAFGVETSLQKVDKYIGPVKNNYPIVGLASLFHMDGADTIKELGVKILVEFAKLAYKMVVLDTINDPSETGTVSSSYQSKFNSVIQDEDQETDEKLECDKTSMNKGVNKAIILEHLKRYKS